MYDPAAQFMVQTTANIRVSRLFANYFESSQIKSLCEGIQLGNGEACGI